MTNSWSLHCRWLRPPSLHQSVRTPPLFLCQWSMKLPWQVSSGWLWTVWPASSQKITCFDAPPSSNREDVVVTSSNNCLLNKTEITDSERLITLLPRPSLYRGVFNELLLYFSMLNGSSASLKQKFVSFTSFALSSLTLSLQLMRAMSHDSHMISETILMLVDFMKVGICTKLIIIVTAIGHV